jgi:hypothetical protein
MRQDAGRSFIPLLEHTKNKYQVDLFGLTHSVVIGLFTADATGLPFAGKYTICGGNSGGQPCV